MKKVVSGTILQEKMHEAVNLLCDTVKLTLGPKGNNVIIDHSNFTPFITNDGVTIAENIESDDEVVKTIIELAKEASIKTNELVGDGTTTTLVLLQSIFNNGRILIEEGISPIILKKELSEALEDVIKQIKKSSRKPNNKELLDIAVTSANDELIGQNVAEVYLKVLNKDAISIKEANLNNTVINYKKGYICDSDVAAKYFFKDCNELCYQNVNILIVNNYLENLEEISLILNKIILESKNLIILANDYSEDFIREIIALNMDNDCNIILLKSPYYGTMQQETLKDISVISRANIIERLERISLNDLGNIANVKINEKEIIIDFVMNKKIEERILEIKNNQSEELIEKNKRVAMFENGIAEILVGAQTITEGREKKMRYDDALWAVHCSSFGILPGCGLALLEISEKLDDKNNGYKVLKKALLSPFQQILNNSGLNSLKIKTEIINSNFSKIYNVNINDYENIFSTKVIDSTEVVINALKNSVSIASMLLTTSALVINEYQNNLNKVSAYNEL